MMQRLLPLLARAGAVAFKYVYMVQLSFVLNADELLFVLNVNVAVPLVIGLIGTELHGRFQIKTVRSLKTGKSLFARLNSAVLLMYAALFCFLSAGVYIDIFIPIFVPVSILIATEHILINISRLCIAAGKITEISTVLFVRWLLPPLIFAAYGVFGVTFTVHSFVSYGIVTGLIAIYLAASFLGTDVARLGPISGRFLKYIFLLIKKYVGTTLAVSISRAYLVLDKALGIYLPQTDKSQFALISMYYSILFVVYEVGSIIHLNRKAAGFAKDVKGFVENIRRELFLVSFLLLAIGGAIMGAITVMYELGHYNPPAPPFAAFIFIVTGIVANYLSVAIFLPHVISGKSPLVLWTGLYLILPQIIYWLCLNANVVQPTLLIHLVIGMLGPSLVCVYRMRRL